MKESKILGKIPESFTPLAMVAQTYELCLEKRFIEIEGEFSHRPNKFPMKNVLLKPGA